MPRLPTSSPLLLAICLAATLTRGETTACDPTQLGLLKVCLQWVLEQSQGNVSTSLSPLLVNSFTLPDRDCATWQASDRCKVYGSNVKYPGTVWIKSLKVQQVNTGNITIQLPVSWHSPYLRFHMKVSADICQHKDVFKYCRRGVLDNPTIVVMKASASLTATWQIINGQLSSDPSDTQVTIALEGIDLFLQPDPTDVSGGDLEFRKTFLENTVRQAWTLHKPSIEDALKSSLKEAFEAAVRPELTKAFKKQCLFLCLNA